MKLAALIQTLTKQYPGLVEVRAWGEISLFFNPNGLLKRGTYCITFKEKDGDNDYSSALNRSEVEYRMSFKISKPSFLSYFDEPSLPLRPAKGKIIALKSGRTYDPKVLGTLIPHPVYGWMSWVSIINPSEDNIEAIIKAGLLHESYEHAKGGYFKNKTVVKSKINTEADLLNQAKRKGDVHVSEREETVCSKKSKPSL